MRSKYVRPIRKDLDVPARSGGLAGTKRALQRIPKRILSLIHIYVAALVTAALEAGEKPEAVLNEGLIAGMNIVGEKFKKAEVFVPEVLVAARAMNAGLKVLQPALKSAGVKPVSYTHLDVYKRQELYLTRFTGET